MNRLASLVAAAVAVTAGLSLSFVARAGDAPAEPQMPPMQKPIESALLKGLVGDWTVTSTMTGPDGKAHEDKATSKLSIGIGGTALIEDFSGQMGGMPFAGHGVTKVGDDGKSILCWWFDTMMPEPIRLSGTVTDTSLEMTGTIPPGTIKIVETKVDGGFDWVGTLDGKPWMTQHYRKAK